MGALSAAPESGDAPMNVTRKINPLPTNTNSSCSRNSRKTPIEYEMLKRPTSSKGNNRIFDRLMLIEDDIFSEKCDVSLQLDRSSIPFHRASLNNRGNADAVLVKDVGVSCTLISDDNNYSNTNSSSVQDYLIKQLRLEYNDLSEITKKLSLYTKDILTHLSVRSKKKTVKVRKSLPSEHANVSNYVDEKGDLCLKLRLLADVQTQYSKCAFCQEKNDTFYEACTPKNRKTLRDRRILSRSAVSQSQISKTRNRFLSPTKRSRSTISNELAITKSKSEDFSNFTFCSPKTGNSFASSYDTIDDAGSTVRSLKRCNPVIFTNWKEISQRKIACNGKQQNLSYVDYPNQATFSIGESITTGMNFHKINIRIIKQKRDCMNI